MSERLKEADAFYASITPPRVGEDEARVMRQALAGMLWSKQYYLFDADRWLREHDVDPLDTHGRRVRNTEWFHMVNDDVISMPDKWEYPWYAAWDLAFHTAALGLVDIDFAKHQLDLMLQSTLHAPERADARLRVELRRRESARARLGHALPVPDGAEAPRAG